MKNAIHKFQSYIKYSVASTLVLCASIIVASSPTSAYYTNGQSAFMGIGQTNPDGSPNYNSSSVNNPSNIGMNNPNGVALDAVRHKLYVADTSNNRVLVYLLNTDNTIPDYTADYVVGQANFSETFPNRNTGAPTNQSLNGPSRVNVEPNSGNVYVSDTGNNRVLVFSTVSANDPTATYVIGASDFTSRNTNGTVSNSRMLSPEGIAFTGNGPTLKIYISDRDFNRVLIFDQITSNGQAATNVLGQPDFISSASATTQTGLAGPTDVALRSGSIYVADSNNNRVMIWTAVISGNGQAADRVIGQTWFYSNSSSATASTMNNPQGVGISNEGAIYVADTNNNRVLVWSGGVTGNGQSADKVLGQSNFTSSNSGVGPTLMNSPKDVSAANGITFVVDGQNHRVLAYTATLSANGQAANYLLGQLNADQSVNFYSSTMNSPQNRGFNRPTAGTIDTVNHKMFVVDTDNNRVLVYNLNAANEFNDYLADLVIGQPNFSTTLSNQGNGPTASTLNNPNDVFYDSVNQRLYIADTGNNRVLIYTEQVTSNNQEADLVLGQSNFNSSSPFVDDKSFASPVSVAVNTGTNAVAVADRDNNRVMIWDSLPLINGQTADYVLGQSSFSSSTFGVSQTALHTPRGVAYDSNTGFLYVADTDNNRALIWTSSITANNMPATYVLGQTNFTTSAAGSPVSASTLRQPTKVEVNSRSGVLYIIDSGNNRGVVYTSSVIADGQAANLVMGQAAFNTSAASTSQSGLRQPVGVAVNSSNGQVYVIDSGNNRVVGYNNTAPGTPSATSPSNGETDVESLPTFFVSGSDADGDALQYQIEIARDSGFTVDSLTFNQSSSSEGWSGQTIGNTYSLGSPGAFTLPNEHILSASTTYYWRVSAYDPFGSKTWTSTSPVRSFTTAAPAALKITSDQQTVTAGEVSDPITIQLRDAADNPVKSTSAVRVYLTTTSNTGSFSAQETPFTDITFIDIPANTTQVSVFYSDSDVGNYSITVSDATPPDGSVGLDDDTQNINVSANSVTNFVFDSIGPQIAGTPFSVTVTAHDEFGNVVANYTGSVDLTSTPEGVTPSSVMLNTGSWTGDATVTISQNTYLTASNGGANGNSEIFAVDPAEINSVAIDPESLTAKAASDTMLTATAYDQYDNEITDGVTYAWTVDPGAGSVSPADQTSTTYTAPSTIESGAVYVSATKESTVNDTMSVVTIPDHYTFSTISNPSVAGNNISVVLSARDANDIQINNFSGSVALSEATGTLTPTAANIVNGAWSGNVVITQATETNTLNASSHSGTVTGASNQFDVVPNDLDYVTALPSSVSLSVNTSTDVSAQAYDQYDNPIPSSSYDWDTTIGNIQANGQTVTFDAGTESGSGTITVTVTDGPIEVTDTIVATVSSLGVDHFAFSVIADQEAGEPFQVSIYARDEYGNNVTNYAGNGSLTYSAGTITPSVTTDFNNGSWTGNIRVTKSATNAYLTFSDGTNSGTSNSFNVTPSTLNSVTITPNSANIPISSSQVFTARAYDAYNNEITQGINAAWSINDSTLGSITPASGVSTTFTSQTKSGSTFLNVEVTVGTESETNSVVLNVVPDELDHFIFDEIPSPQPTESLIEVEITAKDQYENTVTSFTDIALLEDLSNSISPEQTTNFSNGVWRGYVTIGSVYDSNVITASNGLVNGDSNQFDVISNILDEVVITPSSATVVAGRTQAFSVQGYDAFGNAIVGLNYSWSVISVTGIGSVSPTNGVSTTFTASTAVGNGVVRVTATQGNITKQSDAPTTVEAGSLHHFSFDPLEENREAGETFSVTITAKDQYENTITSFNGPVTLSDDLDGINPTTTGPFSQGVWDGIVSLTKSGTTQITATYAAVTSTSDPINVAPAALYSGVIDPTPVVVPAGQTRAVIAHGQDRYGNTIEGLSYTWSVNSSVGTLDQTNSKQVNLTASQTSGKATINTIITSGGIVVSVTADVEVTAGALAQFEIGQINSPQLAGTPFQVSINAADQYGNTITTFNQSATLRDSTNSIAPSQTTNFINGSWSGTITITQTTDNNTLYVTYGSVTTESNIFEVSAGEQQIFLTIESGGNQRGQASGRLDNPLIVKAVDLYGNPMEDIDIEYTVESYPVDAIGYEMSPERVQTDSQGFARSELTLGNKVGTYVVNASIADRSSVNVSFYSTAQTASVASIKVQPSSTVLLVNSAQQFTVEAFDSYGNKISEPLLTWSVVRGGGTVDQEGLFTAGTGTGSFTDTLEVTTGGVTGYASITVTTLPGISGDGREGAGDLDHLILTPEATTVQMGDNLVYSVIALDRYNEQIEGSALSFDWVSDFGEVADTDAAQTTFTAGTEVGTGSVEAIVTQTDENITKSISTPVSITPNPNGYLKLETPEDPVISGEEFGIKATAYNGDGSINENYSGPAEITDSTQTVFPDISGEFNQGVWEGTISVNTADENTIVKLAGDGLIGVSKPLVVESKFKFERSETDGIWSVPYNAIASLGERFANFVQSFFQVSSNFPETTRNVAAASVAGVGTIGAAFAFGKVATQSIAAIGRNPYARKKIVLSMLIALVVCLGIAALSFFVAGFIKFF